MQHTVDLARAAALAAFIHARETGVDDGSRAAGLTDDRIFCHSFPPCRQGLQLVGGVPAQGRGAAQSKRILSSSVYHAAAVLAIAAVA